MLLALFAAGTVQAENATDTGNAQNTETYRLDDVVVTAQKREENVQDVPGSISTFSDTFIEDAGMQSTTDLSRYVPNLEFNSFGSKRHGLMFLRGIKSMPQSEPGTGFYVDGVNYSKSNMFDFPLFDVERIEVLKGPQGTLYGRNSMGGVINIITREPGNDPYARFSATMGSYEKKELQGTVQIPLVEDMLFLGLAGLANSQEGYQENDVDTDGDEGRHLEGQAGRIKLRYTPTDRLDISLNLDGQWHDDGAYPAGLTERNPWVKKGLAAVDDPYHYSHDYEGWQENDMWGTALTADYAMDFADLTSITAYRDYDSNEALDMDFTSLDMLRRKFRVKEQDISQELRLASNTGGPLVWQTGVNYFHLKGKTDSTVIYRPGMANSPSNPLGTTGNREFVKDSINDGASVFGQATYTLWEQLELTAGLRYEYEYTEADFTLRDTPTGQATVEKGNMSSSNDFSALTPKFSIGWHVTDANMVYGTVAAAHRSGGFNGFQAPEGEEAFDEESSWLYEVGSKNMLLDNRLTLNLALFYISIEDEQLGVFNEKNMQSYVTNAGRSHRQGVEAEARYMVLPGLELSGTFAYLDARYDQYEDEVAGTDYKDNHVFCVPEYTYSLAAQYRLPLSDELDLFFRGDMNGVGTRYFDDANDVRSEPYELVNFRAGVEWKGLDVYFWLKNTFDAEYVSFENTKMGIAEYGEPRTLGMTVSYRF